MLNGKDTAFFCNTLTKTMDKNKGRPTSLPMRRVNRQVQNWAIRLKNSAFGVSNLSFCLCLLLIFFLYARHLFICEIIEFDLLGNILSDEFITRISDEAKKTHDTKTYRA